jgi:hypothetical protein
MRPDPIGPLWCLFPDPPDTGCSYKHLRISDKSRRTPVVSLPTDFRGGKEQTDVCTVWKSTPSGSHWSPGRRVSGPARPRPRHLSPASGADRQGGERGSAPPVLASISGPCPSSNSGGWPHGDGSGMLGQIDGKKGIRNTVQKLRARKKTLRCCKHQHWKAWRPDRWKKRYVTLAKKPTGAAHLWNLIRTTKPRIFLIHEIW